MNERTNRTRHDAVISLLSTSERQYNQRLSLSIVYKHNTLATVDITSLTLYNQHTSTD